MIDPKLKVGQLLKTARRKKRISQQDLAYVLKYRSGQIVSNWERGICFPPKEAMAEICSILRVKRSDITSIMVKSYINMLEGK